MRVELLGVPRRRVGIDFCEIPGETVGQVWERLLERHPQLNLGAGYAVPEACGVLLSLNGRKFVSDLEAPVVQADTLLVLTADAGG